VEERKLVSEDQPEIHTVIFYAVDGALLSSRAVLGNSSEAHKSNLQSAPGLVQHIIDQSYSTPGGSSGPALSL
jgi:hypothetical protein